MGKRKERRLAALSNAGRRVKLDLFLEPSGDLGGSPEHDEVGGDIDPTQRAGLPNSPSSSGEPQNPLLLLGQYSDDEVDEESNNRPSHAIEEDTTADHNHQVEGPVGEGCEVMDVNADEDHTSHKVYQQDMERTSPLDSVQNLDGSDTRGSDASASADLCKEMGSAEQISVAGTSDVQIIGDVSSGWKIVMHAESNQYYYWNTETGETSWEVPDVLTQLTELSSDQRIPVTSDSETAPVGLSLAVELDNSSTALTVNGSVGANLIPQSKEVCDSGAQMDERVEGYKSEALKDKDWAADVNQNVLQTNSGEITALSGDGSLTASEKYMHDAVAIEEHQKAIDLSTHLVKQCECLLERLKSLKGSKGHLQGDDWVSKYILEVEIRHSDIKSLLSHGSSLLPFWAHSERQLKRLEGVINNEIYQLAVSAQMDDAEATPVTSFREEDNAQEGIGHQSEVDGNEHIAASSSPEFSNVSTNVDTLTVVEKDSHNKAPYRDVVYAEHVSSFGSPSRNVGIGAAVSEQVDHTALPDGSIPKPGFNAGEDDDMDVDMEVEDAVPAGSTIVADVTSTKDFVPAEQPSQPNQYTSLVSEDVLTVPPPPDEEWIPPPPPDNDLVPPPPPDNEQVPPPPPDEPPEPSYPSHPSYMETGQPLTYTEQYNLTYLDSNFQYYGHTVTELQNSNFYGHVGGGQVALPHASLYYEAVPSTYTETAPLLVNPVEAVSYYGVQDGTVPPVPGSSSVESSQFHSECGPMSYNTLASDQIESVDAFTLAGPNLKVDVPAVGGEIEIASVGPPTSATIQAPATISVKESVSAPSTYAVTAAAPVAAPSSTVKVQSKVLRNKKRTAAVAPSLSLRSNKKVSGLVDKWKAAKEELNEIEEEEPKSALEILEKKRQREIEEWKAKQIASGEAKDNANFQPLGGDWRERVKRRRAQAASEAAEAPAEAPTEGNQQPDLAEFSRDLPSGWQAYWDDTSKQVYYGNTITSETTWSRPTK